MVGLPDAGIDIHQGGFRKAEGASQQLTVLREAAGFDLLTWRESFDMRSLRDAGMDSDQGGFGAAECASQRLTVLREAAGFDMISLQGAGRDKGGWSVADGPRHELAVLLRSCWHDESAGRR